MITSVNEPGQIHTTTLTPRSINEPAAIGGSIEGGNAPKVTGVDPAGCTAGDAPLILGVTGINFVDGVAVTFDGVALDTTFVSDTSLTAALDPTPLVAGGYPVSVKAGELIAPVAVMFTVADAAPEAAGADPDELEDEIEQAGEEGDFKPLHRGRPTKTLPTRRK
jgi:hypothetical protein